MRVLDRPVSVVSAPQGKLTQAGEVFQPSKAVNSLLERLAKSPGMSDNIGVIQYYAKNTDYVKDTGIHVPIGYDPKADVIRFNPNIPLPEGVDRDGILAHELAHRADHLIYGASMNQAWQDAIKQAEEALKEHESEIGSWFKQGGKFAENAFLADIISALSLNRIHTPYGHPKSYWREPLSREREVFANLFAIDMLYGIEEIWGLRELGNIIDVFKYMIHSGEII